MGKMLEPQILPPQPIQSCKTPEQTNYKMESGALLERRSTEHAEDDELLGTGSCCCASPDSDDLNADESASASSSSLDLTRAEKVRSNNNESLSSQQALSGSEKRIVNAEPDAVEGEHDEDSVAMSDPAAEEDGEGEDDHPEFANEVRKRQMHDDDLPPTLSLSASYLSGREQGDLPASAITNNVSTGSNTVVSSSSVLGTVKSTSSGYKSTTKATSVTRMGKSGPGPSNGTKACAKKSFVWKYFRHPEMAGGLTDRSRTQCVLCDSQLAFNASGTTTTMLNHLKSRHGDVAEQEESTRRHVRPGKGAQHHSQQQHNHSTPSLLAHENGAGSGSSSSSFNGRALTGGQARLSRGPLTVGQRGRPPGSNGRRAKCAKFADTSNDYLNSSAALPNSQLKSEGNPMFPLGCYPGLTEQQQRALLNEFFSAENLTTAKEPSLLIPGAHAELQTLMTANSINVSGGDGSGLSSLGIGRTETTDMHNVGAKSSMTTAPSPNVTNTSTTAPTTILHRNSLLNAAAASVAAAFANGSFTGLPPLPPAPIGCCTTGPHDSSPSSSSGLGVSVTTSPLETPTTNGGSPNYSAEASRCVTSPTTVQHTPWILGSHTKPARDSSNLPPTQTSSLSALTEPHPDSSITNGVNAMTDRAGRSSTNGFLTSPVDAASVELQSKLLALGLPFPTASGNGGTASIQGPVVPTTSDIASTFGSFMNFIPPFNGSPGTGVYPTIDPFSIQQQHHHHQQQQQQQQHQHQTWLAANAWLASLANGKFLASSTAPFGADQSSQMINLFANCPQSSACSMGKVLNNVSGEMDRIGSGFSSPFLIGSRLDQSETSGMPKVTMDGSVASCWPQLSTSATSPHSQLPMTAYSASELLLSTAQQTVNKSLQAHTNDRRIPTTTATMFTNLTAFGRSKTESDYTRPAQLSSRSPVFQTGTLDLSQGSGNNNSPYRISGEGGTDGSVDLPPYRRQLLGSLDEVHNGTMTSNAVGGNTASTKRKRARPIYISPEFEPKRRILDGPANSLSAAASAASSSSCAHEDRLLLLEDDGPMNLSSPSRSDSPGHENTQDRTEHRGHLVALEHQTDLPNSKLTRDEFLHQLAYYLVKDLQPPEVVEGDGFRTLLNLISNHDVPKTREIRDHVLPSLATAVQSKIARDLSQLIQSSTDTESTQLDKSQSPISTACAVELWPAQGSPDPVPLLNYHANLELHCSSGRANKRFPGRVVRTLKVTNSPSLKENLEQCVQLVQPRSTNATETVNVSPPTTTTTTNWPLPLVTNQPAVLNELVNSNPVTGSKTDNPEREYLVIPCLLSELSRAVTCGLNLPEVQRLLQTVRKSRHFSTATSTPESPQSEPMRVRKSSLSDFNEKEEQGSTPAEALDSRVKKEVSHPVQQHKCTSGSHSTSITWSSAFELLKSALEQADASELTRTDLVAARKLLAVLETMNQTLELIHRKDLSLTGSMIEPILQNLIEIRLAPEANDPATETDPVQMFKACVADHLSKSYTDRGELRVTLQLASLLDPRFKDHVQEQKPATIKLLKTKADTMSVTTSGELTANSHQTGDSSSVSSTGKAKSITESAAGLETVFGLARPTLSEVDRYLREDPIGLEADPLAWWRSKAANYPRLIQLALNYLTIPLTCYATGRLKPIESVNGDPVGRFDGLGLPNIVDPLGRDRLRLSEADQSVYNVLWHNLDLFT